MVNILELLEKRAQYPLANVQGDTWVDDVLAHHRDENEQWIVVPAGFLMNKSQSFSKQRAELFGDNEHAGAYYLVSLFDVGNPYLETGVSFTLLSLSKVKPKAVKIANYKGDIRSRKRGAGSTTPRSLHVADNLADKYKQQYPRKLQMWCTISGVPQGFEDQEWELCEIPYDQFDFMHPYPGYYMKSRTDLRNLLKETDVVPLSAVAEVIVPVGRKENGPVFRFSDAKYPFDWDVVKDGSCSETRIQKGDILVSVRGDSCNIYLFDDKSGQELYAPRMSVIVVRPKTLPSEFLFLYLKGEAGQDLPSALSDIMEDGTLISKISRESLSKYPVLRKTENPELYREYFQLKYLHDAKLGDFNIFLGKYKFEKIQSAEDVLSQNLMETLHYYKSETVLSLIKRDIKELNICYRNGAYKATLIMAGSILEGLAIDWLSLMYGEDFFIGVKLNTKCRELRGVEKPVLEQYIEVIANNCSEVKIPEWMTRQYAKAFKTRADEIRHNRNLVHATLCLKGCETIDRNLCDKVIGFLKDIIKIRFRKEV